MSTTIHARKQIDPSASGRAIARAGEEKGIRCNVIAPGFMDPPMGRDASRRRRALTVPSPRRQPPAPGADGAVRPPGHRLGGGLCCAVPDFE